MQTQQKKSISQKQEISWQAKLTSDYGHMHVCYVIPKAYTISDKISWDNVSVANLEKVK